MLVRHGQSIWNQQNRFTGWVDVSLSWHGMAEAEKAGKLLAREHFDIAFTSALLRAQDTLYEILKHNMYCEQYVRVHKKSRQWYEHFTPAADDARELRIYISEKLNERYYGDLQGLNKDKARQQFGEEQVHIWRRSYDIAPPNGESLKMTTERTLPYYKNKIVPELRSDKTVLISAHGNSLRALIMHIEKLNAEQIIKVEIPTGTPHVYDFDNQLTLLDKQVWTPENR